MQTETHPSLMYGRIAQNRRNSVLIAVVMVTALAPFVLGVSYLISTRLVRLMGSHTGYLSSQVRADEESVKLPDNSGGESLAWRDDNLAKDRGALAQSRQDDWSLILKLMPVIGGGLVATLGLLFWGTYSSPTISLLTQLGALPAGDEAAETKRLLEDLSVAAGLPPPKLYIVDSSVPSTFSAGTDPRSAVLAVTRAALELLDKPELEGLLAHELSHIGNQDSRLNVALASVSLCLRIPYKMFRRRFSSGSGNAIGVKLILALVAIALSPLALYIFFVAPLLGRLIRAVIWRRREFMADSDAAVLTRNPSGLVDALAKIAGAASADPGAGGTWLSGNLIPTHDSLNERIHRLVQLYGEATAAGLPEAVEKGRQYAQAHPSVGAGEHLLVDARDELAALNQGNAMGRVCRLLSSEAVPVYDSDGANALVVARVQPGALLVVFDDLGGKRQVNTAQEIFGYIDRKAKLKPVAGVVPQEVYNPQMRAAAEAPLTRATA